MMTHVLCMSSFLNDKRWLAACFFDAEYISTANQMLHKAFDSNGVSGGYRGEIKSNANLQALLIKQMIDYTVWVAVLI